MTSREDYHKGMCEHGNKIAAEIDEGLERMIIADIYPKREDAGKDDSKIHEGRKVKVLPQ